MCWDDNIRDVRKLGFKVVSLAVDCDNPDFVNIKSEGDLIKILQIHAHAATLHGLMWFGHGNPQILEAKSGFVARRQIGVIFHFTEIDNNLTYRLGFGSFNSCHSGFTKNDTNVPIVGGGIINCGPPDFISKWGVCKANRDFCYPNFNDHEARYLLKPGQQGSKNIPLRD